MELFLVSNEQTLKSS